jgi:cobalamin biosynthesis protein CobC
MFEHGGNLAHAVHRYGRPLDRWLDLSTGINPNGYPVPPIPPASWAALPELDDGLAALAAAYYALPDSAFIQPCAGSEVAIRLLPTLLAARYVLQRPRVGLLWPGFAGHARAWAAFTPSLVLAKDVQACLPKLDILVLAHPNNPTGFRWPPETLLSWSQTLAGRGGFLVVDEAFMDATPNDSLCPFAGVEGIVVLRSLGKFFGLAGARVGFIAGPAWLMAAFGEAQGPWPVAGPSRWVAMMALSDSQWQENARRCLSEQSQALGHALSAHGLASDGHCAFFHWVCHPKARQLHEALAQTGIWTRLFSEPASVRFGLPGSKAALARLTDTLFSLKESTPCLLP